MSGERDKNEEVVIRPFRSEDTETIVAITGKVFAPASIDAMIEKMLGRPAAEWREIKAQGVRKELEGNPEGCFVAELGGKVVGYVTTVANHLASRGIIPNLAVSGEVQDRGIGRRLLLRALEYFRGLGLAQAKIETLACNEVGQHLYPSLGFRELARQIHYVMPLR
jgi:ribosomal protein S18 acetylase RimI-like enzyme